MALADLIVIMNDGRIEQAADPRTVFEQPATAFVARFMGDHNVISGKIAETTAKLNYATRTQIGAGATVVADKAVKIHPTSQATAKTLVSGLAAVATTIALLVTVAALAAPPAAGKTSNLVDLASAIELGGVPV